MCVKAYYADIISLFVLFYSLVMSSLSMCNRTATDKTKTKFICLSNLPLWVGNVLEQFVYMQTKLNKYCNQIYPTF